ncbi:hypothetical protein [Bremerella sp.]|uniref:hypothetical protein n=1 Tax=Bremerella sp. TaxID=2795602 RepID=UPI00391B18F3
MQVTQANGFDGNGEALVIVNQVAAVVDELLPGEPPFGVREIHVSLDDRRKAVPRVQWEKQDHVSDRYRLIVAAPGDAWWMVIYEGFCRTMPLAPGNLRGVRKESHLWQRLAFQLAHELAAVKFGPARSNLQLQVMATAVALDALERIGKAWKQSPPRMSQGIYRAKRSTQEFHEQLMAEAEEAFPQTNNYGMEDATKRSREERLAKARRHVNQLSLWHPESRAWQMIAADCLLAELRSNGQRWTDLTGLAMHTYPSAWDEAVYRDDLPLVGDVVPTWWPDWLR